MHQAAGGAHPAVRAPAGDARAGAPALLRDGRLPRRLRARAAGREPRGPADQGRGQSRSPREPRRHRRIRPGPRARPLRSRPLEGGALSRAAADLGRFPCGAARAAREAQGEGRRGAPLPDGPRQLTDARRADAGAPPVDARREVGELGAGFPRQHARRSRARVRRAPRAAVPLRPGRRDPEPRGRLRLGPPVEPAARARVRGAPEGRIRPRDDEPALRRRGLAELERRVRRSPPGAPELGDRGLRARGGCRLRARGRGRRGARVGGPDRQGPEARRIQGARARRREPAGCRPRARPRDQRGARGGGHDRQLHGARRGPAGRRDRGAQGARRGDAAGRGRDAGGARRESRLRGARRPEGRRSARQGAVPRAPRDGGRRERRTRALASPGVASARELGRPARGRRHRDHRPAADRAALPHAVGDRGARRLRARRRHAQGLRHRARALAHGARRGRLRHALEPRAPRRRRRWAASFPRRP